MRRVLSSGLARPKLLGGGMSSMALTRAFTSSVAKSSGYMLTSANVIMVSVIVADFLYRKTMPTSVFSQVRIEISTRSYSNFGLEHWLQSRRNAADLRPSAQA